MRRRFSRGRALRMLKLGGGISRIVSKVMHHTSWMARAKVGRHRKAVLQMSATSGIEEDAIEKAYVDRMLQMDEMEEQTGEYGGFNPAAVYAQASIFADETGPAEFSAPALESTRDMQRSLDEFF